MERTARSKKIICLGVDGLDPRFTKKMIEKGKMPNVKKYIERGSAREDLVMLGGHPTVTPPMWTTLATGAYANTHGITSFYRRPTSEEAPTIAYQAYNLSSLNCKAEQVWNCFAEAGLKTLVWHWPGSAWPPSSDSENLLVVDGTVPGSVNIAATVDKEFLVVANSEIEITTFKPNAASDISAACVIDGLEAVPNRDIDTSLTSTSKKGIGSMATMKPREALIIDTQNQGQMGSHKANLNVSYSSLKPASGWSFDIPADALEFTILLSSGLARRPVLVLKNEDGIYDKIQIFKNKKESTPLSVAKNGEFVRDYLDIAVEDDGSQINTNRDYAVLAMDPEGKHVRMWISSALDYTNSTFWSPTTLLNTIRDNVGYPPPTTSIGSQEKEMVTDIMLRAWDHVADWQADSLIYMLDHEGVDAVFSHYHAVDLEAHRFIRYLYDKGQNIVPTSVIEQFMEDIYVQTDRYLGKFLRYLDEGASVFIFSDHAQVCPHTNPVIGDIIGVNVELMEELGYTVLKTDENGNKLKEIDWSKTRAIAWGEQHIYVNLKSKYPYGIVDDEDKYELEEQIMTDLYGYKHPETGKRVIAVALRNKDAVLLGQGGPEAGDICYWTAEGYNYDHADSLSTAYGECDTSVSPIFIAAGNGIKEGYTTDRVIRQVDLAPTLSVIAGVRFPAQCEGAPVYQILTEEL